MKHVRTVLISAVVLGLLSDFLFHDSVFKSVPWGLNLFVWLLSVSVASLILTCRTKPTGQWKSAWFLLPPLFLAAGCVWRDSAVLRWLDVGLIAFILCASSMSMMGCRMMTAGITHYFRAVLVAAESLLNKPYELLFRDMEWKGMLNDETRTQVNAVLRGVLIALPLLAVFGGLFVAADAAFEGLIKKSFQLDVGQNCQHLLLALGSFWCAGGFLHGMFNGTIEDAEIIKGDPTKAKLGMVEVGVVLGLTDLLFLSFVVVQTQYFFGGANLVEVTNGLTYADYARRGFFELVTVASLVIPILLFLDWMVEKTSTAGMILLRALTGMQIGLLFVIMISAVQRMQLYQSEYGMTELRFYTTAFMAWLAIVCVIFIATVLRGHRKTFAFCSVMSGLLVVCGLHVINPDALIVETNIARAKEGKQFDVKYALLLSNDAIPVLVSGVSNLKPNDQKAVFDKLKSSFGHAWKSDWRSWNWSGSEAFHVVGDYLHRRSIRSVPSASPTPLIKAGTGAGEKS